jgi:hypothetical protein
MYVDNNAVIGSTYDALKVVRMLGLAPALLHPRPERVLVIGYGAGVTTATIVAAPGVQSIEVAEIVPEVVEAARFFEHLNHDVLRDPRVRVVANDGRNHLCSRAAVDVTCDPVHPLFGSRPATPGLLQPVPPPPAAGDRSVPAAPHADAVPAHDRHLRPPSTRRGCCSASAAMLVGMSNRRPRLEPVARVTARLATGAAWRCDAADCRPAAARPRGLPAAGARPPSTDLHPGSSSWRRPRTAPACGRPMPGCWSTATNRRSGGSGGCHRH